MTLASGLSGSIPSLHPNLALLMGLVFEEGRRMSINFGCGVTTDTPQKYASCVAFRPHPGSILSLDLKFCLLCLNHEAFIDLSVTALVKASILSSRSSRLSALVGWEWERFSWFLIYWTGCSLDDWSKLAHSSGESYNINRLYLSKMNPKQSRIPNFFKRSSRSRHEDSSDSDDVSLSLPSKVKEKLDKKWKWTRVHDIEKAVYQPVNSVDVLQDLQSDMTLKMIRRSAVHELGVLMFDPEAYND